MVLVLRERTLTVSGGRGGDRVCRYHRSPKLSPGLSTMARPEPRWRGERIPSTQIVAREPDAQMEGRCRRGLRDAHRRWQHRLMLQPPRRGRGARRPRCRQREGALAHEVSCALSAWQSRSRSWRRPEGDATVPPRKALHARHQRHRVGLRCVHRETHVAEARATGAPVLRHRRVAYR
jgi:hypothetical protein